MQRTVYYAATSADGFIAARDGGVAWLEPFNSPDLGYERFLETIGAVVLGRATYEQSLTFGPWPYPGRPGVVVSSAPIDKLPELVKSIRPAELPGAVRELRASTERDVWIVGGAKTAGACCEAGLVDELEIYVVPYLLGDGIPLLDRQQRGTRLRLLETRAFANGVVMLRHAIEQAPT